MPILFSFRDIQGQIIFFFSTNIEDIDSQHTLKFAPNTLENIDVFIVYPQTVLPIWEEVIVPLPPSHNQFRKMRFTKILCK